MSWDKSNVKNCWRIVFPQNIAVYEQILRAPFAVLFLPVAYLYALVLDVAKALSIGEGGE